MADVMDSVEEKLHVNEDGDGGGNSAGSSLLSKEFLIPAAATAAAGLAATQGPKLAKLLQSKLEGGAERLGEEGAEGAKNAVTRGSGAGELGKLATGVVSKARGGKGGGGGSNSGKTRRLPIERWTDVAVPVEHAYEQWTKFEDYPKFMHRVLNVKQKGDDKVEWDEKIWFSKRHWTGKVTDRRKNDRIAWKTEGGMAHAGVVSFHRLDKNLTRIMVTMEFVPQSILEKMASGLRFVKRAVEADLARFKAYVEMGDARGIEYRSAPAAQEEEKSNAEGRERKSSRGEDESSGSRARSGEADDKHREADRRGRESRRQERREALAS
jgi:uncharacterized membrane protein